MTTTVHSIFQSVAFSAVVEPNKVSQKPNMKLYLASTALAAVLSSSAAFAPVARSASGASTLAMASDLFGKFTVAHNFHACSVIPGDSITELEWLVPC